MGNAVEIRDVSKMFRIFNTKFTSLKERVINFNKHNFEEFWALRDVEFNIAEGETVGLLGHNGSGKSTLLKCIAGILLPTTGEIKVRGRIASMLELGAGFHPELSGRANVYLNAALLGIPKREVEKRFDAIVGFAELDMFIDTQVKYYSSGMYTRLGFAVAVNVDPDVLLVDEVLAVGDENFQRKCIDKVRSFQKEGRTIVFVSHSPDLVRSMCDRAYVLDHGRMVGEGPVSDAISILRDFQTAASKAQAVLSGPAVEEEPKELLGKARVVIGAVDIQGGSSGASAPINTGDSVNIGVEFSVVDAASLLVNAVLELYDVRGETVYRGETQNLGIEPLLLALNGRVVIKISSLPVGEGVYGLGVGFTVAAGGELSDWKSVENAFKVLNPRKSSGVLALELDAFVDS